MKLDELDDITRAATEHYVSRFGEIERLLNVWAECENAGHYEWAGDISDRLDEMPLSVELEAIYLRREQCEWSILLGTGGPADRVLVTTDLAGNVEEATYQHRDWFTAWTDAYGQNREVVESFANRFYFRDVTDGSFGDPS